MYGAHCLTWSVHKDCEGAEREATCISWTLRYRGNGCSVVQILQCVCVFALQPCYQLYQEPCQAGCEQKLLNVHYAYLVLNMDKDYQLSVVSRHKSRMEAFARSI